MAAQSLSLQGRVAIVTGGAGGIGTAVMDALSAWGARAWSIDRAPCRGFEAFSRVADVTDSKQIQQCVDAIAAESGRLDAVVACAGITRDRVLWKLSDEEWRTVIDTNLDGSFYLLRASVPHFRKANSGSVVLISSINGERGKFGQSNYSASKAGVIGLAKSAARELGAFGVRVNVVAPGFIETAMTQQLDDATRAAARNEILLGKAGVPSDVANAVLFFCSDLSSHVTGQVLRVDGGQYL
jgi:acetoacetyl-CoA reductase/3-oxoacyl-[acyl-carrier protein] reductase